MYGQSTNDFSAATSQLAPGVESPSTFPCPGEACPVLQTSTAASTYGWYVEPRLNFQSRFFIAPGFRLDGGSGGSHASYSGAGVTTGGLGGLSAFPKVDFSWVAVDRQNGKPLLGTLTLLRPRLAFGVGGTQPGPGYKLRLFNVGQAGYTLNPGGTGIVTGGGGNCTPLSPALTIPHSYQPLVPTRWAIHSSGQSDRQELEGGFTMGRSGVDRGNVDGDELQ